MTQAHICTGTSNQGAEHAGLGVPVTVKPCTGTTTPLPMTGQLRVLFCGARCLSQAHESRPQAQRTDNKQHVLASDHVCRTAYTPARTYLCTCDVHTSTAWTQSQTVRIWIGGQNHAHNRAHNGPQCASHTINRADNEQIIPTFNRSQALCLAAGNASHQQLHPLILHDSSLIDHQHSQLIGTHTLQPGPGLPD